MCPDENQQPAEWTYRPGGSLDLVELGTVEGCDVGLPAHFHDEDQLTFVLSGRRRFVVGGKALELGPGSCALIPAGTVHRSMPEPAGVACLNLYVRAADSTFVPMVAGSGGARPPFEGRRRNVSALAAAEAMSREGYSRAFARHHGMPPHAHGLASRLNRARGQLRAGAAIADVAIDAGFADQSHFGRWFRRLFGVAPGRYRTGWSRSQTYQTHG